MVRCRPLTDRVVSSPAPATHLGGRLTRADRARSHYAHLPFDVPSGAAALRISLDHDPPGDADHPSVGAVLDLGLIGPGSLEIGTSAFRGWSGSERRTIVVGSRRATPGYRPGSIEPGRWHVILGLYAIPAGGCTYRLDVEVLADEPVAHSPTDPASPAPRPPAAKARAGWIACDLHAHTVHSDGSDDVATLARRAGEAGIEVLFVTDHNTDSHLLELAGAELRSGVKVLPGEEITTYGGHLNALGVRSWVDFRDRSTAGMRWALATIHAQGGLASVNHPCSDGSPWTLGADLPFDLVEVWNGPWSRENEAAMAWWMAILAAGRRPTAVGGSDTHGRGATEHPVGGPATWTAATRADAPSVMESLRAGRVIVTRDATVAPPRLWARTAGGQIAEIGGALATAGSVEVGWDAPGHAGRSLAVNTADRRVAAIPVASDRCAGTVVLDGGEAVEARFVRLEIREPDGDVVALTNPIYLEGVR